MYRPTPFHAGPSAHIVPVCSRCIGVLNSKYFPNRRSTVMMSGSGYIMGEFPLQSRGVAFGETCCAKEGSAAAPKAAARNERRSQCAFCIPASVPELFFGTLQLGRNKLDGT